MNDYQRRYREESKKAYAALMKVYPLAVEDLPDELWLPVPDFEDYQISNFGRVKSFKYKTPRILKPKFKPNGYLCVCLCKDGATKTFLVHRLVALCFIPNPLNKPEINHCDGCKFNNHVSNLEWATRSENVRHAVDTGLQPSGEDNYQAKLTNDQVRYIRENPDGLNQYKLADLFNANQATISGIQLGKKWKHAGGVIRQKRGLSDDIRTAIRAEYVFGSAEFGSYGLAKKYGVCQRTILNIIHENNVEK